MSSSASGTPGAYRRALKSCQELQLPPEITRISPITPGKPFTVDGICFGSALGHIALRGLAGLNATVSFTEWSDTRVVGVVHPVAGVEDGNVELALSAATGERAVPRMARFRAQRETVRVPAERWSPYGRMSWATSDLPAPPVPNPWPDVSWGTPPPALPQRFALKLRPSCRLLAVGIEGEGVAFTRDMELQTNAAGDEAVMEIGMTPADVFRFGGGMEGGLRVAVSKMQRGHYLIGTEALCPVGIKP